jgi:hypothetical protein
MALLHTHDMSRLLTLRAVVQPSVCLAPAVLLLALLQMKEHVGKKEVWAGAVSCSTPPTRRVRSRPRPNFDIFDHWRAGRAARGVVGQGH